MAYAPAAAPQAKAAEQAAQNWTLLLLLLAMVWPSQKKTNWLLSCCFCQKRGLVAASIVCVAFGESKTNVIGVAA
jgi:hypothetical protein